MVPDDNLDLGEGLELAQIVNVTCDFVDLENCVCRYIEAGLVIKEYKDSLCSACLSGLEFLKLLRNKSSKKIY